MSHENRRGRARQLALLCVIWTAPGLLASIQSYVLAQNDSRYDMSLADAMLWHMPTWYFWVAATYAVLLAGRAAPFERGRRLRSVGIHLGTLFALSIPHVIIMGLVPKHLVGVPWYEKHTLWHITKMLYPYSLNQDALTYGAILGVAFGIDYQRRLRARTLDMARLESRVAQAELAALRARLQPHFLFNTLNAIGTLVRKKSTDDAITTLSTLSRLLRHSLDSSGRKLVTVHEEIEFVRDYLSIEKTRLGDRLTVSYAIDSGASTARLPSLFLQPLVENAVIHGIAPRPEGGTITIAARVEGDRLSLLIDDDGAGLPPGWELPTHAGHGMSIMVERMRQQFGADHVFEVSRRRGRGTRVHIMVPLMRSDRDEPGGENTRTADVSCRDDRGQAQSADRG